MIKRFSVETTSRSEMIDITPNVQEIVSQSGVRTGLCLTQVLHTTAGITINENADPNVTSDILAQMTRIVPFEGPYTHAEGNSDAHLKASLVGFSSSVFIDSSNLLLGTWQAIYLCEFDGPRQRHVVVKVTADR